MPDASPAGRPEPRDWSRASSTSVKVFNAITFNLARFGLVGKVDPRIWAMTTQGRRSGRRVQTPVAVHQLADGREVVLAAGRWRHNFAEPHPIELRQGRRRRRGPAHLDRAGLEAVASVVRELAEAEFERGGINAVNRLLSTRFEGESLPADADWPRHAEGRDILVVPS